MRPLPLLQLLQPLPAGHLLFRAVMLASFRWGELQAGILSRLTVVPAPAWLLRWALARRERMLLQWHRDLSDLRHLEAVLTSR